MRAINVACFICVFLLLPKIASAITIYFGSAKVIAEARLHQQYGNYYDYSQQHYFYHFIKKEAYPIDSKDLSLGFFYPNCGSMSECPFYHNKINRIVPFEPLPSNPFKRYFLLPDYSNWDSP
jgi:hypothetical protein